MLARTSTEEQGKVLGLRGKAPVIVMDDADINFAVGAMQGFFLTCKRHTIICL